MSSIKWNTRHIGGQGTLRYHKRRIIWITHDVVEQVAILAQLAHKHTRYLGVVFRDAYTALLFSLTAPAE